MSARYRANTDPRTRPPSERRRVWRRAESVLPSPWTGSEQALGVLWARMLPLGDFGTQGGGTTVPRFRARSRGGGTASMPSDLGRLQVAVPPHRGCLHLGGTTCLRRSAGCLHPLVRLRWSLTVCRCHFPPQYKAEWHTRVCQNRASVGSGTSGDTVSARTRG